MTARNGTYVANHVEAMRVIVVNRGHDVNTGPLDVDVSIPAFHVWFVRVIDLQSWVLRTKNITSMDGQRI